MVPAAAAGGPIDTADTAAVPEPPRGPRREIVAVLDGGVALLRSGRRQASVSRSPGRVPVACAVPAGSSTRPLARQR